MTDRLDTVCSVRSKPRSISPATAGNNAAPSTRPRQRGHAPGAESQRRLCRKSGPWRSQPTVDSARVRGGRCERVFRLSAGRSILSTSSLNR
jgi:hypothetical protein